MGRDELGKPVVLECVRVSYPGWSKEVCTVHSGVDGRLGCRIMSSSTGFESIPAVPTPFHAHDAGSSHPRRLAVPCVQCVSIENNIT